MTVSFGRAGGLRHLKVDQEPVVVFHERVAGIRQPSFFARTLLGQQRFGIRTALMRRIRALFPMEVHPPIAGRAAIGALAGWLVSRSEALEAGRGLDQRAVHGEVLIAEQVQLIGLRNHRVKEAAGDIVPVVDTRTARGMQDVYGGAYAAGCIYVPAEFTKKYPNTAQALVNAMVRALRFIQTSTPDQIVAAVPADYYTDKALYKTALEKNVETFKHDGIISMDAARSVYRDLKSFDPGVQNATVDLAKTINMTFTQKADQKYK